MSITWRTILQLQDDGVLGMRRDGLTDSSDQAGFDHTGFSHCHVDTPFL